MTYEPMDMTNPFAIAVAAGIKAAKYREKAAELGGSNGLDRFADRCSDLAEKALNTGLQRLGLAEPDPAAARQRPTHPDR